MDMCFYWVQDCIKQKHFNVFWKPRSKTFGDYHIKHHAPIHHFNVRTHYIHCPGVPRKASVGVC